MKQLDEERQKYKANIPGFVKDEDDMQRLIKKMELRFQTTTMSNQQEKELLRDIENLKRSVPDVEKVRQIQPKIDDYKSEISQIRSKLDDLSLQIMEKDAKISEVKQEKDENKMKRDEIREEVEKYNSLIDEAQTKISSIYKEKDETRE